MFFVPEAQLRDTKLTVGIIPIWYFNKEHISMARSEAEGILHIIKSHSYPTKYSKSIKCKLMASITAICTIMSKGSNTAKYLKGLVYRMLFINKDCEFPCSNEVLSWPQHKAQLFESIIRTDDRSPYNNLSTKLCFI